MNVTTQILIDHLNCNYKLFLRQQGEVGVRNEYARFIVESRKRFANRASSIVCMQRKTGIIVRSGVAGAEDLRMGDPLLLDVTISHDNLNVKIDAAKRIAGNSTLGDFYYIPVFFHSGRTIRKAERLLLAVQGLVLGSIQDHLSHTGMIISGDHLKFSTVTIASHYVRAREILDELVNISRGKSQPPLILNDHCHECHYKSLCWEKALAEDNLSLLDRIGEKDVTKYNSKGIFSLHQLSYTFRHRRRSKRAKKVSQPHSHALQALALREKRIHVFEKPNVPIAPSCVYLDMEGDERGQFVYLIGVLIVRDGKSTCHSLWADSTDEEEDIFSQLLDVLMTAVPLHLFHYGRYEAQVLKRIENMPHFALRYEALDLLKEHCTNALSKIFGKVYFPTYSNRLKEVARYFGCSWSEEDATGLHSIMWRQQWEESQDAAGRMALKNKLIQYNKEDCFALKRVVECLSDIDTHEVIKENSEGGKEPVFVENIVGTEWAARFGRPHFASEGFEIITRAAYFDYQQTKVLIRTDANKRARKKRLRIQTKRPTYRINRVKDFRSRKCTFCGGTNILRDHGEYRAKLTLDLRVTSSGIKRWITKCRHARHTCNDCSRHIVPKRYKGQPRIGHALMAWTIHQHVVNRTTFEHMEATLRDHYGLQVRFSRLHELKSIAAKFYQKTYNGIIKRLVASNVIHADETKVRLKKEDAYVWIFANTEDVLFVFQPSRKADFLHDFLSDFNGVLVTDFYTGYDSLKCLQQKCLLHLLRDINDALLKNPFDAEVKAFGYGYGEILRQIVDTIDRFGLRRKCLAKHKKDTERWLHGLKGITFKTELVEKLRKRVVNYGVQLFEFLNHDGVTWNNNNAEHAIKYFAKYRRLVNGRVTEQGIRDYLVLLSIYQTCHYRGISFWEFLLSGQRDINHFAGG